MAPKNDDQSDLDRLARRYLDLWQSQLSGLAADQALTEQIARLFAAANAQVAAAIQTTREDRMQPRMGPRPLPLHLGTALMTWASSESAWRLWKHGSPSSKQGSATPEPLAGLVEEIGALDPGGARFAEALHREIARRMDRLGEGVLAYRRHPVRRALANPPAVWSEGNTRLLDYGATDRSARVRGARAVLVVPSLINRWEVLDLTAEKSLLRAMAAAGLRPYLVDWGTPDAEERRFDLSAYVARLERALGFIAKRARRAPAVMGYCMGGTLAVALAQHRPRRVAGLALLAAPWDFHADKTGHAFLLTMGPALAELADKAGELPVDVLQTLYWSLDPWLAMKKFGRFSAWTERASMRETSSFLRIG
jgi:polyhydroxyalkanoate synthase